MGGREGEREREIEIGSVKRAGAPRDRESRLEWGTKSQDPQETRDGGREGGREGERGGKIAADGRGEK